MADVGEKPWWLRLDGAPPWLERNRDRQPAPLRASEIWILRVVAVGAVVVLLWSSAAGHLNLGLALLLSIATSVAIAAAGMTPSQRRQVVGRKPPDRGE
jgi:small-conductance mechanosensitive channel